MDVSREYIKMCQKAKEIQELFIEKYSFSVYTLGDGYSSLCINLQDGKRKRSGCEIWLPRQDQLQEIFAEVLQERSDKQEISSGDVCHIIFHFIEWLNKQRGYMKLAKILNNWPSMEQLWLAFVMKEKYSKIWTGKEWKDEPES